MGTTHSSPRTGFRRNKGVEAARAGSGHLHRPAVALPAGNLAYGRSVLSPCETTHDGALRFVGAVIRGISGIFLFLLAVPLLLRFVRWVGAMWRRRRFSSTPGADPGHPSRR